MSDIRTPCSPTGKGGTHLEQRLSKDPTTTLPAEAATPPEHACGCSGGECAKEQARPAPHEAGHAGDEAGADYHGHGHRHAHWGNGTTGDRKRDRARLFGTLGLTLAMMVFEAIGGALSGSLALLSDAGHMLTDAAALLLAALAIWFASRPADLKRTYGFFRLEILSAFVNGLTLIGIAVFICWEAAQRIAQPHPIKAGLMLVVAVAGLVVNLVGMALLSHSSNMNVRAAFLHVVGDALSSVGVIVAGVVAWLTNWTLLDPLLSIGIALLIAFGAVDLVRDAVHVLLEAVPAHIDLAELFLAMKSLAGVREVHDLHVWTISHSLHALSAHLVCAGEGADRDELLVRARAMLREKFDIDHATLQIESEQFARREHGR